MNCGGGSIKSQMKRADKAAARLALIIGDDEYSQQRITLKNLVAKEPQITISVNDLIDTLKH